MWFGQDETELMPSSRMRTRSSARPWIAGKLEIPPAALRVTPGTSVNRLAVSLAVVRPRSRVWRSTAVPSKVSGAAASVTRISESS